MLRYGNLQYDIVVFVLAPASASAQEIWLAVGRRFFLFGNAFFLGETKMHEKWMKFLCDDDGVTAIEYGLIAGLIAVGIIAGATTIGGDLTGIFDAIGTKLTAIKIA